MGSLFSIGHSNGSLEEFFSLLKLAGINCVVDVRSVPASSYAPQFNKDNISRELKKLGIFYMHFGDEFGARRNDSIVNGQVNFEKAVETPNFRKGVERIMAGVDKGFRIALMCSEANPLSCHRFSLVSRYFYDNGLNVSHILHTNEIESHQELEQTMISEYLGKRSSKLRDIDELFGLYTAEDQRCDAYRIKNIEIGYRPGIECEKGN